MATDLGSITVDVEPKLGSVFAVVVAATRLHDALYYHPTELRDLPQQVRLAYGELQHALNKVNGLS